MERLGLALPLDLGDDPHAIRTTCGGERLHDSWRVDQTDEAFPSYLLSDWSARWPPWGFGGVLQSSPTQYEVWKASRADTSPVITDQGTAAPGWLDLSCREWGVTARLPVGRVADPVAPSLVEGPPQAPPWELWADGEQGVLTIYFHPPHVPPSAPPPGEASYRVELEFHQGPHPVGVPRELTDEQYRALLRTFPQALDIGLDGLGLPREGTEEERIERIIASNYQPSVFLRRLQDWQVRGVCEQIGLATSEDRETTVARIIAHFAAR